jgi:hypothetical protein
MHGTENLKKKKFRNIGVSRPYGIISIKKISGLLDLEVTDTKEI